MARISYLCLGTSSETSCFGKHAVLCTVGQLLKVRFTQSNTRGALRMCHQRLHIRSRQKSETHPHCGPYCTLLNTGWQARLLTP
jgi:hypothetical protein